jgi:arylsulfatase A-like enzyme
MMMKNRLVTTVGIVLMLCLVFVSCVKKTSDKPNILWITSEDNSPLLGCYGDTFATTPNLDQLASEGFLYTHAYANAPVCAPARNTIITGVYANSAGNQHMRSYNKKSDSISMYPEYLRKAGYYCTNNRKTDYNIDKTQTKNLWDECGDTAHYKNRRPGQPFFAIFNIGVSHEVVVHRTTPPEELRHHPDNVPLPPYHPATDEMKHDWAQYYDRVEDMDAQVGNFLAELDASGEANNTIVFYYSDHGGVLARSKRFVYETGTRVPFIVRIPEKYKHLFPALQTGSKVDRLISFVDLAPTLLSLLDIPIPEFMQGNAFLGRQKAAEPEYVYMFKDRMDERYDMARSVRDRKYRYIRNYMPYRPNGQHLNYLWNAPSARSWERAYNNGECNAIQSRFWLEKSAEELYNTENDPWEVNNLVNDPDYSDVLNRMRLANNKWVREIHDAGFIPENDLLNRTQGKSPYDFLRQHKLLLDTIINAADKASLGKQEYLSDYRSYIRHADSAVRYWGATGLLMLQAPTQVIIDDLKLALCDTSPAVAIVAAEALYRYEEEDIALKALKNLLSHSQAEVRCMAMNAIDCLGVDCNPIQNSVLNVLDNSTKEERRRSDIRLAEWLSRKWNKKN